MLHFNTFSIKCLVSTKITGVFSGIKNCKTGGEKYIIVFKERLPEEGRGGGGRGGGGRGERVRLGGS